MAQTDFVYGFKIQGLAKNKQSAKALKEHVKNFQNRLKDVSSKHKDIDAEIKINDKSAE